MLILSNYSNTKLPTTSACIVILGRKGTLGFRQGLSIEFNIYKNFIGNLKKEKKKKKLSVSYCAGRMLHCNLHMSSNNTE